jgi:hypothetical protein
MDMLSKFFKNDQNSSHPNRRWSGGAKWRFRGHARDHFWRWVCSWARAARKPSDLGFSDDGFDLPPLEIKQHIVEHRKKLDGYLFSMPAVTLQEQRQERSRTVEERCESAAAIANKTKDPIVCWAHLNSEADMLTKIVDGAIQVSGSDCDDRKEEVFSGFAAGEIRAIVTKPIIAGFGLNWQHCNRQTFFPSHSFEQWYQAVRRCWRFGQKRKVVVDIITTEGEARVLDNLKRKQAQAEEMFAELIGNMNNAISIENKRNFTQKEEVPSWL